MNLEESREFWGVSTPSILSNSGVLISIVGFYFAFINEKLIFLPFLGTLTIISGIILDIKKGLRLKWRRINFFFHLFFLCISLFLGYLVVK